MGSVYTRREYLTAVLISISTLAVGCVGTNDPETYGVGDEFELGSVEYKINRVVSAERIGKQYIGGFIGSEAEGIFIVAVIEFTNTGDGPASVFSDQFKLLDAEAREFAPGTTVNAESDPRFEDYLTVEDLQPGLEVERTLAFDVPTIGDAFEIRCEDGGDIALVEVDDVQPAD